MKSALLKFIVIAAALSGLAALLLSAWAFWSGIAGGASEPFLALSLLVLTLGVLLAGDRRMRRFGRALGLVAGLVGALPLLGPIAGIDLAARLASALGLVSANGFGADGFGAGGTAIPAQAVASAASLLCFAAASLLLLLRRYAEAQAAAAIALLPNIAGGLAALLGTQSLFGNPPIPMLAATVLCGCAILGGIAHRGAIRVFLSKTISGSFGRKQMAVATLAPIGLAVLFAKQLPEGKAPDALAETVASIIVIAWVTMGATALIGRKLDIRRHRAESELRSMARYDALTGLLNRRSMNSALPERFEEARAAGKPIALLMCDLDHFKLLNDEFGHAVGDDVLRRTAGRISASVRESDLVFRYGGEEISVLLDCGTADALRIAEKIRLAVRASPTRRAADSELPEVTISIGVAVSEAGKTELRQLLAAADECLYAAKDAGRDCVRHMIMR